MTYQAPHQPESQNLLAGMIAAIESGQDLPPVVVLPCGIIAITGSHRIAAYQAAGKDCPSIIITEAEYSAACEFLGVEYLDEAADLPEQARAVYKTTARKELVDAVSDQF